MTQPPNYPPPSYPNPNPGGGPAHAPKDPWYKRRWVAITATAFVALVIGTAIGQGSKKDGDNADAAGATTTATVTATPLPAGTKTLQPTVVRTNVTTSVNRIVATKTRVRTETYTPPVQESIEDGTYEVGRDIESGRYRTAGGMDCYFSVNGDANGSDIIENGTSTGQQIVDVRKGQYLELSGGCTWEKR